MSSRREKKTSHSEILWGSGGHIPSNGCCFSSPCWPRENPWENDGRFFQQPVAATWADRTWWDALHVRRTIEQQASKGRWWWWSRRILPLILADFCLVWMFDMPLPKTERVVWDKFPNRIHVCHLYVTLKGILFVWMSSVGIWHWTTLIKKGGWLQGVAFSGFEPLELINHILGRKDALRNTCYTLHSDSLLHIRIYIYITIYKYMSI